MSKTKYLRIFTTKTQNKCISLTEQAYLMYKRFDKEQLSTSIIIRSFSKILYDPYKTYCC